jgi:type I restriction enzyme S subunit
VNEWQQRPIRELCTHIIDCVNKTAPSVDGPTAWRMIRTTNVRDGRISLDQTRYVEQDVYEKWVRRGTPRLGDIILTREAPLGEVGRLRDDVGVFLGQRLVLYRPDEDEVDGTFLLGAMRAPGVQNQIKAFGSGSTVEHMRVPDCGELLIDCPPISEQRKIGAFLSAIEELIEINERRIELLEDLARSLYREWFVHFRYPGSGDSKSVDSEMGRVPEGWTVWKVEELASTLTRGIAPKYSDDGGWVVVNQRCIRNRRVDLTQARHHGGQVPDAKRVQAGDVLINSTGVGTLGRVAVLLEEQLKITADSHVTVARVERSSMHSWFGLSMLEREHVFQAMGTGSTGQTELRRGAVGELPILVPPQPVLAAFDEIIRPLLRLIPVLRRAQHELTRSRDVLLPRLVNGQLDISDVDLGTLTPGNPE